MRYILNATDVTYEMIEEEVIAINLKTGSYYSFGGSANVVWTLILAGWTADEIAARLALECKQQPGEILVGISELLEYVIKENLVVPSEESLRDELLSLAPVTKYTPPTSEKYTDMQELLLVDPIHEVTEAGWPQRDN
jgi:hypothetical protein